MRAMSDEEDDKQKTSTVRWDAKFIAALAALVAACVGLANSCIAYRKAEQESLARDSYKVTTLAIERLSDESKLNHDEVVALRGYLEEHIARGLAQQLDYPPPSPPMIEARPAPVQVSRGSQGARYFPTKATPAASAAPSTPVASAAAVDANKSAPRPPAQMTAEWPEQ